MGCNIEIDNLWVVRFSHWGSVYHTEHPNNTVNPMTYIKLAFLKYMWSEDLAAFSAGDFKTLFELHENHVC